MPEALARVSPFSLEVLPFLFPALSAETKYDPLHWSTVAPVIPAP